MAEESIIKLVFLRETLPGRPLGRKAVVPLVDGADVRLPPHTSH
jgi:hypothetical protein